MARAFPIACAVLLAAGVCLAQTAASGPAAKASSQPASAPAAGATSQPAAGAEDKATVVSVTGQAQRCDASVSPKKWEAVKAGDVLNDLTIIRTGLDSGVVLNLAGRGEVRIGSATKIGITEFRKEGATAKTALGLKYGTIEAEVDSKKGPADFRVTTPTATLSVRGSHPQISFGADAGTQGFSLEGQLSHVGPGGGQTVNPGEGTNDRNTPPVLTILQNFWVQGGGFVGLSLPEFNTLLLNHQGRAGGNVTPPQTNGQGLHPPPVPPVQPGPGYP